MKIYIAGPYSAPTAEGILANINKAIDAGIKIWQKGHSPLIPHTNYLVDERAKQQGVVLSWQDWMEFDAPWLDTCDAILYLEQSPGADIELERAEKNGLKLYFSVEEIPKGELQ